MFAELAAAAAGALGTAVGTDAWKWITGSVKALFQKAGTPEAAVEKWLEDTTADVSSTSEPAEARARAERRWASRLEDLLDARPDLATDLQALVERAQAAAPASQGNVVQQANAHDQAQQAVQGHGTQHNTFNAPR